ncbi:MAG: hypothetical protein AAFR71_07745 [Pseudomonadota bacterium]
MAALSVASFDTIKELVNPLTARLFDGFDMLLMLPVNIATRLKHEFLAVEAVIPMEGRLVLARFCPVVPHEPTRFLSHTDAVLFAVLLFDVDQVHAVLMLELKVLCVFRIIHTD